MTLDIGLIGCGTIARQVYLPLLQQLPGARLAAVADPDGARLAAARPAGAALYSDPIALLDHPGLGAVIIATPSHLHAEPAVAAFERGLHVYVEKPLASRVEDGERMVQAWRTAGTVGAVGFHCRFTPLYLRLRTLLDEGRAGTPVCVRTTFATAPRDLPAWKRERASGGGVLLDLASHHIDLVRFLFRQDIEGVQATLRSRHTEDDTALLELHLADGLVVQSFFSLAAAEHDRVEVYGERARLSVGRFTSLDVAIADNPAGIAGTMRGAVRRVTAVRRLPQALAARRAPLRDPGYARALARFVARASDRRPLRDDTEAADLYDGLRCLAVIAAAERAARGGSMVMVEPPPPVLQRDVRAMAGARGGTS